MATAALAAVAHLVLLVAPLACGCAPKTARAASAPAHACCCKPGDKPMPCSSQGPKSSGCAASHAPCAATLPDASPACDGLAPALSAAAPPLEVDLAASFEPREAEEPEIEPGTAPRRTPIGLVLTRASILII